MSVLQEFTPKFDRVHSVRGRTIVVAGGAGFIGSNLCRRLINQGDRVICTDNLDTGRRKNLAALEGHGHFRFIEHDIVTPFQIAGPVAQIYNLACPASPPKYQRDPIHTFQTCIAGSMNLLELARAKGARILQSSTSEVYGDPNCPLQAESYRGRVNTVGPRACYDEGKRAAETLFYEMHARHGVDVRIARIFNTYGPAMDPEDGRVVSNFLVQALKGEPLTIYGDGQQTRSFCYIGDLLNGLIALMEADPELVSINDPVNLGNPGEFTMLELAELVLRSVGSRSPIVHLPLPQDDPQQRCPDITRAGTLLGWRPEVALQQGLLPTAVYFRRELEEARRTAPLYQEEHVA
nr:UDP-glucuronic acid decarboxylase family protein [uncultured Celeribacter sp.]